MDHVLTCLNPSKHLQHQLSCCRPMNVMKVAKRPRHLGSTFWVKMVKVWAGCSQQDRMPFKPMISDIACGIKAKSRVFLWLQSCQVPLKHHSYLPNPGKNPLIFPCRVEAMRVGHWLQRVSHAFLLHGNWWEVGSKRTLKLSNWSGQEGKMLSSWGNSIVPLLLGVPKAFDRKSRTPNICFISQWYWSSTGIDMTFNGYTV